MTTSASTYLIELLSLPAFIEGNIVHLPYGVLEIAGGCSGLRYFLVSLILALYFSQQRPNAPKIVASMFFIAALFSLFANWIRVTLLIIIAEKSNMQSSLVADHETFGWIVYLVVMAPCVWAMLVIEKRNLANSPSSEVPNASTASSYELKAAHLILAIIITGISPLLVGLSSTINASKQGELSIDISPPPSGWMKTATSKSATYTSGFIGVQQENNFSLVNSTSGTQVHVQVLSYTAEEQGSELINDSNQLADKQWNIANTSTSSENLGAAILTNARRDQVAVLWYFRVGDYRTSNPLKAKLAQLLNVFSPDTAKAHVSLSVQCSSNCEKEMLALNKLSTNYRPY